MKRIRSRAGLLALSVVLGLGSSARAGAQPQGIEVLEVLWTIDTSGYDGFSKLTIRGEYDIVPVEFEVLGRPDVEILFKLAYRGGGLLSAQAALAGERAVYRAGRSGEGGISLAIRSPGHDVPAGSNGIIRRNTRKGTIEIFVTPGVGIFGESGPTDEASGCWDEFPDVTMAETQWRDLATRPLRPFRKPVDIPEASECRGTMIVEVKTLPLELKYHETGLDVAALEYGGEPIDPHVLEVTAGGGSSWIVHANFRGEALVNGVDQIKVESGPGQPGNRVSSAGYLIDRQVRQWDLHTRRLNLPWHQDNSQPVEDWIDNPSVSSVLSSPDTWPPTGVIDEFLVKVKDRPGFGFVYVAFAMEIRGRTAGHPPGYRIRYSAPEKLDAGGYGRIYNSPTVHASGLAFRDPDEGWVDLIQVNGRWTARTGKH